MQAVSKSRYAGGVYFILFDWEQSVLFRVRSGFLFSRSENISFFIKDYMK